MKLDVFSLYPFMTFPKRPVIAGYNASIAVVNLVQDTARFENIFWGHLWQYVVDLRSRR